MMSTMKNMNLTFRIPDDSIAAKIHHSVTRYFCVRMFCSDEANSRGEGVAALSRLCFWAWRKRQICVKNCGVQTATRVKLRTVLTRLKKQVLAEFGRWCLQAGWLIEVDSNSYWSRSHLWLQFHSKERDCR